MASGTFTGSRAANKYGPWLTLHWTEVEQQISNNRTKVRLTLRFHWDRNINYNFGNGKPGTLHGSSYTFKGRASGSSGSLILRRQDFWVGHGSDGKKSQNFAGDIRKMGLTWSGIGVNTMSVSGTATLTPIPRKSDLTGASMYSLQANTAISMSISRSVKYTGFYHLLSIYDGNTWVWDTGYFKGSPATSYSIPSGTVNKMLNRMKSTTSKNFRVRLRTYTGSGGSGLIGESARNMTVNVHSNVTPSASGISVAISGSGRDKTINKYVQNITRVTSSFNSSAGYGASVSSRSIVIRRVSGSSDSQTISGASGTTGREVRNNGTYEAIGTVKDSRGRTATSRTTFTVEAYSTPRITNFTAVRNESNQTIVKINRTGSWSHLGGSNPLTIKLQRKQGSGAYTNVVADATGTNGTYGADVNSTGNDVTLSYDFRLYVVDTFGKSAESLISIGTAKVLFDKHKDLGIGIGKLHERGELDVAGEAHFSGNVFVNSVNLSQLTHLNDVIPEGTARDTVDFWTDLPQGIYLVRPDSIPNQPSNWGILYHSSRSGEFNSIWYQQPRGAVYRKSGNRNSNGAWRVIDRPETGKNSNGEWIRFNDGTQIVWGSINHNFYTKISRYADLPIAFKDTNFSVSLGAGSGDWREIETISAVGIGVSSASKVRFHRFNNDNHRKADYGDRKYTFMAIGRWK